MVRGLAPPLAGQHAGKARGGACAGSGAGLECWDAAQERQAAVKLCAAELGRCRLLPALAGGGGGRGGSCLPRPLTRVSSPGTVAKGVRHLLALQQRWGPSVSSLGGRNWAAPAAPAACRQLPPPPQVRTHQLQAELPGDVPRLVWAASGGARGHGGAGAAGGVGVAGHAPGAPLALAGAVL